jgi:hypothetical protein
VVQTMYRAAIQRRSVRTSRPGRVVSHLSMVFRVQPWLRLQPCLARHPFVTYLLDVRRLDLGVADCGLRQPQEGSTR